MSSAHIPTWAAAVDPQGVLRIERRPAFDAYLRSTYRNQRVRVQVEPYAELRSLDQNAFLHSDPVLPTIAAHVGDSVEGVKLALMGEKWGWKTCPMTGAEVPVKPRTSLMTKAEFAEFIEWLPAFCLEKLGLDIPLPDPRYWEAR